MIDAIWDSLQSAAAGADTMIWGDSGEAGGTHHRMALTLGFCITHSICVLGSVGFFQGLRTLKLCEKHRIMPDKEPDPKVVRELYGEAVADHFLVQWLFIYFAIAPLYTRFAGGLDAFAAVETPSAFTHIWQIMACMVLEDGLFYWVHRTLHHKALYKHCHHEHHIIKINHPLAAQHAHILEKLIGNSIPFWTPAILLNVHCTTFMMWTVFRITEAIEAHSGYDLPFSPFGLMHDGGKHDFHHSHGGGPEGMGVSGSYGSWFEFWDRVCGTDADYNKFAASQAKEGKARNHNAWFNHGAWFHTAHEIGKNM